MHYRKTVLCIVLKIIIPITSRELEEEPTQQVTVQNDCLTCLCNNLIPMKRSRKEGRKSKEEEATSYNQLHEVDNYRLDPESLGERMTKWGYS